MTLPENPTAWAVKAFRDDRATAYSRYRAYIEGEQPLMFAMDKFRRAFGRLFEPFAYNRCGSVVDAHADRIRVAGFGSDNETLAQLAEDLWQRTGMDTHEGAIEADATGLGDAHLLVQVDPTTGEVQYWPQSPEQIRVHYDTERPGVRDLAAKMWKDEDTERMHLNLYFADRIEKYRTVTKAHSVPTSARAFEPYQPDGDTEWPVRLRVTDTVPIFSVHNNARVNSYGTSELRDVLPLQDALNLSLSEQLIAGQFAASPQWVLLNYIAQVSDDGSLSEADRMLERFVAGVGQLATIPPNSPDEAEPKVAEFSAANLAQYDLVAEKWDVRIGRVTRVPIHYITGETKAQSGRAKRLDEAPFVAKLTDRTRERGPVYAEAQAYGLRLEGVSVPSGALRVNFEPVAPLSDEDIWDIAMLQMQVGWPLAAIAREMGRDPDEITQILREKREEADAAMLDLGTFASPPPADDDDDAA